LSGAAFWRPAAARRNRPLARYGSAVLFDEPILALDPQLVGEVALRTNTT
jgi:ABC-type histidine transport system ATPase subunit